MILCLSVCLSVCLSACISQKPHVQTTANFLCMLPVAVAPNLLWRHFSTLLTSGFVNTVIFYLIGPLAVWSYCSSFAAMLCTGCHPYCTVLVMPCPRRQHAPRLDKSFMQGVPGMEYVMRWLILGVVLLGCKLSVVCRSAITWCLHVHRILWVCLPVAHFISFKTFCCSVCRCCRIQVFVFRHHMCLHFVRIKFTIGHWHHEG